MEKGMPAGLKEHMDKKKDGAKDDKDMKDKAEEEASEGEVEKSEEYSDVITSSYLNWMEDTLKSGGVDTDAARNHFDDLEKANLGSTPEEWDAGYTQHTWGRGIGCVGLTRTYRRLDESLLQYSSKSGLRRWAHGWAAGKL